MDWIHSQEGANIIRALLEQNSYERKTFGYLERPIINSDVSEVVVKIFVCGKAGIGKTDTIALLTGSEIPTTYSETEGITVMVTYWPIKLASKVILMRLEFWDAGDYAIKKFSHILPSCKEDVDLVLYTFSFNDRKSFEEIPKLITEMTQLQPGVQRLVVGTRFDNHLLTDVTLKDVAEFEEKWKMPLLKVRNNYNLSYSAKQIQKFKFGEAANVLNALCNYIWVNGKVQNKTEEL